MTLKQFQYYMALYRCGNLTKAAEKMYISRPVLSRAISDLEKELGIPLFERLAYGVKPTQAGTMLFNTLEMCGHALDETIDRLKNGFLHDGIERIRVGIPSACGSWFFPTIIEPFSADNPDVNIQITSVKTESVMDTLINCELDLAIAPKLSDNIPVIRSHCLFEAEWFLCIAKEKQSEFSRNVTLGELQYLPIAILETIPPPYFTYHNMVISSQQISIIHDAVVGGYAFSVLPSDLVSEWDDVAFCQFTPPNLSKTYLMWNDAVPHGKHFHTLRDFIQKIDMTELQESFRYHSG